MGREQQQQHRDNSPNAIEEMGASTKPSGPQNGGLLGGGSGICISQGRPEFEPVLAEDMTLKKLEKAATQCLGPGCAGVCSMDPSLV